MGRGSEASRGETGGEAKEGKGRTIHQGVYMGAGTGEDQRQAQGLKLKREIEGPEGIQAI